MAYVLAPSVEREILRLFAKEDVDHVRAELAVRTLPMDEMAPPPRVHIAVLWLSRGNRQRFDSALTGATLDWRDTLVEAGLANDDWRDILTRRGLDLDGF